MQSGSKAVTVINQSTFSPGLYIYHGYMPRC